MRVVVVHTGTSPCECAGALRRSLESLGHEAVLVDSEAVLASRGLLTGADLVVDHSDTFRGRGELRSHVRALVETAGGRLVGTGAMAALRADDKASAKAALAGAGVGVPPGIAASEPDLAWPSWLLPPLVLKPAFGHMSRGHGRAESLESARRLLGELLERHRQAILVESFVAGRELAVSVIEKPEGPWVLPILEWLLPGSGQGILDEPWKLADAAADRSDARPANLSPALDAELRALAVRAFRVLELRDYARFDVRLTATGSFVFLEANVTPSVEPEQALALSSSWQGWDHPTLVSHILASALRRHGERPSTVADEVDLPGGPAVVATPPGVHRPTSATRSLARLLDVMPGEVVLDLGCGSGLLGLAAARAGARLVVATDVDPSALDATAANFRAAGLESRLVLRAGPWYEALRQGDPAVFDLILATPPQTPSARAIGPKWGGPDGTRHLMTVIEGAPVRLDPVRGRLVLHVIGLADLATVEDALSERFERTDCLAALERPFSAVEYDTLAPGLFAEFAALRGLGHCSFEARGDGYVFEHRLLRSVGPRRAT